VNLTQRPFGTKRCGGTKIPCILMKFSMNLSLFLKDYSLEEITHNILLGK
jgi:hypothetical protein